MLSPIPWIRRVGNELESFGLLYVVGECPNLLNIAYTVVCSWYVPFEVILPGREDSCLSAVFLLFCSAERQHAVRSFGLQGTSETKGQ